MNEAVLESEEIDYDPKRSRLHKHTTESVCRPEQSSSSHPITMTKPRQSVPVEGKHNHELSMFGYVMLTICILGSIPLMFWLTYSQMRGCNSFCIGPQSHIRQVKNVPHWILYQLPFLYLLYVSSSLSQGYAMRLPKSCLDASPLDLVMGIRTNISTWTTFNTRGSMRKALMPNEAQLRLDFAKHIARPHCNGYESFGPLPEILTLATIAFEPCLLIIAYIAWWETTEPDGRYRSREEKLFVVAFYTFLLLCMLWMVQYSASLLGWSMRLNRFGRIIRQKSMQSRWEIGEGYEGSEAQLMWWIEMLLKEEDDDPETANERFELTVIPVINKIQPRFGIEGHKYSRLGALEAGIWSDVRRRWNQGRISTNSPWCYLAQMASQEKLDGY